MARIVIAPDKFKGTLSTETAARIIGEEFTKLFPKEEVRICPMADGGEGTSRLLGAALDYHEERIEIDDALMQPAGFAPYYVSEDGRHALLDSSAVIGLTMIRASERNPWKSTSYALGKVVKVLFEKGVKSVGVCIGGTATVDCGIGFLQALGAKIFTVDGLLEREVKAYDLHSILKIDVPEEVLKFDIYGISDVDVPLLDTDGYPSMLSFAEQKGIDSDSMIVLQMAMEQIIERTQWDGVYPDFECRFGGAGGGLGFAIHGVLGKPVENGARRLIDAYGIFDHRNVKCVVTGEGRFDFQSLAGKVVGEILSRCNENDIQCIVIAGCVNAENISFCPPCTLVSTENYPPIGELTEEVAELRLRNAVKSLKKSFISDSK